eukprot:1600894-Rhodomonas_salina.2
MPVSSALPLSHASNTNQGHSPVYPSVERSQASAPLKKDETPGNGLAGNEFALGTQTFGPGPRFSQGQEGQERERREGEEV